jgi:thymidylate kinase
MLIVFQAMDAAGKDSSIKHIMSGLNPQGVRVTSFKTPHLMSLITIFSGDIIKNFLRVVKSAFSTDHIMKMYWLPGFIRNI